MVSVVGCYHHADDVVGTLTERLSKVDT